MEFEINGIKWRIKFVKYSNEILTRSDGIITAGVTDMPTKTVYISDLLRGAFLRKVVCHEMVHCFMFSYDISIPIEQEEFIADWMSVYGEDLIYLLDDLMKEIIEKRA